MASEPKAFKPQEHLIDIGGRAYMQVADRLIWFREDHPNGRIDTECISATDKWAHYRATISYPYVVDGTTDQIEWALGSGHGQGFLRNGQAGEKFHERGETVAIGRALGVLGYGTQWAEDLDEGDDLADAPRDRGNPTPIDLNTTRSQRPKTSPETAWRQRSRSRFVHAVARELGMTDDTASRAGPREWRGACERVITTAGIGVDRAAATPARVGRASCC